MLNKLKGKLSWSSSSRTTRSMSSSRAGFDMQVDVPSIGPGIPQEQATTNVLMEEANLRWQSRQERDNYKKLKPRKFSLTNVYDPRLL